MRPAMHRRWTWGPPARRCRSSTFAACMHAREASSDGGTSESALPRATGVFRA